MTCRKKTRAARRQWIRAWYPTRRRSSLSLSRARASACTPLPKKKSKASASRRRRRLFSFCPMGFVRGGRGEAALRAHATRVTLRAAVSRSTAALSSLGVHKTAPPLVSGRPPRALACSRTIRTWGAFWRPRMTTGRPSTLSTRPPACSCCVHTPGARPAPFLPPNAQRRAPLRGGDEKSRRRETRVGPAAADPPAPLSRPFAAVKCPGGQSTYDTC